MKSRSAAQRLRDTVSRLAVSETISASGAQKTMWQESTSDLPSPHPPHWVRGQLLNMRKYSDGTFHATLANEDETAPVLIFPSSWEAQQFVSQWYQREYRAL